MEAVASVMRFSIGIQDREVPSLLKRLVDITGASPWHKKFSTIQQQFEENRFLGDWIRERHGIEVKFAQLLIQERRQGGFPLQLQDKLHYELAGFAAGVVRIYEQLSSRGRHRLRGMLLDGLKPDNNLLSVQHEMVTAVHLISRGYDLVPNDLEVGSGVDFVASEDGLEIEVECKCITGDLGRKLVRRKVLALNRHIAAHVERIHKSAARGILVRIPAIT